MTMTSPGDAATAELQQKSLRDIQRETAIKWAGRASAAAKLGLGPAIVDEYRHEAIEHAALSGDALTLASVRQVVALKTAIDPAAVEELKQKSLEDIQAETAFTWAWRAYAAYHLWLQNRSATSFRDDALEYKHEAIEHGALADNDEVLRTVRRIVDPIV
jgi:hypothetical protein